MTMVQTLSEKITTKEREAVYGTVNTARGDWGITRYKEETAPAATV